MEEVNRKSLGRSEGGVVVRSGVGRPEVTSHAEIEQAAFQLFAQHGFDGTTLDAIARAVGVGRRTLFRYYGSKNDIPWGQFTRTLSGFRALLWATPSSLPLLEAIKRGVVAFNDFPEGTPSHRERMRLILRTPALQAHSVLRYAQWRRIVAEFSAQRRGEGPDDLVPQLLGQLALAMALSAYDQWLADEAADLERLIASQFDALVDLALDVAKHPSGL